MINKLFVYINQEKIGILNYDKGQMNFEYFDSAKFPLSISMPLSKKYYKHDEVLPFLEGVLPEGRIRASVAKQHGISEKNIFKLLSAVGGDCAGAVSFYENEINIENEEALIEIALEDLITKISKFSFPHLNIGTYDRLSLAGMNEKIVIIYKDGKYYEPNATNPSNYIIKLMPNLVHKNIVENEFFCLSLAKAMDLPVCDCELKIQNDYKFLLIKRYDRYFDGGNIKKIHQEDFAQALKFDSSKKYENEGGPNIKKCVELIDQKFTNPALAKSLFMKYVVFNYLVGNADAHAKNFSILHNSKNIQLSPLYDVVSTEIYEDLNMKMAMKIGGEYLPYKITKKHWQKFADDLNVNFLFLRKNIEEMSEQILEQAKILKNKLPELEVYEAICNVIEKRKGLIHASLASKFNT